MSCLVKRHSSSKPTYRDIIYSPDSSSLSTKSSYGDNQSELSENPVRHLYLVRHGQYQRQRTESDGHLTLKGEQQAWYAANFLISQLPENVLFDSLTHSNMIRTRETARIVYKQLKLMNKININYFTVDTDFREENFLLKFLFNGNWYSLKRDYFHLKKSFSQNSKTTFEIIITHRNIIAHCIQLLTMIQPDKSIAFNASVTHIIVSERGVIIDYAYKHNFLPYDLLTMWEIFLPEGQIRIRESNHPIDVNGVKGIKRKDCCLRFLILCFR